MSEFRVGEIAIIKHVYWPSTKDGDEVEIAATERVGDYVSPITGKLIFAGKVLIIYHGEYYQCWPIHLRKRRPPPDWVKLCNLTDTPREVSHV